MASDFDYDRHTTNMLHAYLDSCDPQCEDCECEDAEYPERPGKCHCEPDLMSGMCDCEKLCECECHNIVYPPED